MTAMTRAFKVAAQRAVYWTKRLRIPLADFGTCRTTAIVRYHSVSDSRDGNYRYVSPAVAVSPAVFEEQIAFLAGHYRCVTMDDVAEALVSGRPAPRNAVVVTFDDGYRDNYDVAFPILRRYGVPAIFYVTTGCLDGGPPLWMSEIRHHVYAMSGSIVDPVTGTAHDLRTPAARERANRAVKQSLVALTRADRETALADLRRQSPQDVKELHERMLTWGQVREMLGAGMQFGAHTVSHPRLTCLPAAEARQEIEASRAELAARARTPVRHFAYPNPSDGRHWDEDIARLVMLAGFDTAVTSESRYVQTSDDRYTLGRVPPASRRRALAWDLEREALRACFADPTVRSAGAGIAPASADDVLAGHDAARHAHLTASLAHRQRLTAVLASHRAALADLDRALTPLRQMLEQSGFSNIRGESR